MKKYVITTIYTIGIFLFAGLCQSKAVYAQPPVNVVAVVNGKSITQQEVDETITAQILPLEQQLYALRKVALENLINKTILEAAAAKKSISLEELRKQLTAGKVEVSTAQVEQLYSENASVFAAMSPDEAKERLRLDLESQARMKLYRDGLAELRKNSRIELLLAEASLPSVMSAIGASPTTGSKDAVVTIIEFSDFQCPYCRSSQSTLKQVLQNYGKQVRLVFKHLPLEMHAQAFGSAQAAVCANEQGRFWEYQDALFSAQDLSPTSLSKIAKHLGMSDAKFKACVSSDASRATVLEDVREAKRLGIAATPTFIVNGNLVPGAISFEEFKTLIERELKSAKLLLTR